MGQDNEKIDEEEVDVARELRKAPPYTDPKRREEVDWRIASGERPKMTINEAARLKAASNSATTPAPQAHTAKSVWGFNGTEGISPEEARTHKRNNMTQSWGPKPSAMTRTCKLREGNVTKRMRMDRDRLATIAANTNVQQMGCGPPRACFFQPVPLRVVQTNKNLVGLPLQRTYPGTRALSTDPYVGMGAAHALSRWVQRSGY